MIEIILTALIFTDLNYICISWRTEHAGRNDLNSNINGRINGRNDRSNYKKLDEDIFVVKSHT